MSQSHMRHRPKKTNQSTSSVVINGMQTVLIDILRLTIWLAILVAVFVPLERFFALRPAKVWRAQIGVDLGWYFINALTTASIVAPGLA